MSDNIHKSPKHTEQARRKILLLKVQKLLKVKKHPKKKSVTIVKSDMTMLGKRNRMVTGKGNTEGF